VLVSLGEKGAVLVAGGRTIAIAPPRVEVVDTVGAGDALNGALAAGLVAGMDLEAAVRRAVVAASLAVTRSGARDGMPTTEELERILGGRGPARIE
jgi:ribokinase